MYCEVKTIQPRTQASHMAPECVFFPCGCTMAAIMSVTKGLRKGCVYGCAYTHTHTYFMLLLLHKTRVLFLKSHAITNMFGKPTAFIIWRLICLTDNRALRGRWEKVVICEFVFEVASLEYYHNFETDNMPKTTWLCGAFMGWHSN